MEHAQEIRLSFVKTSEFEGGGGLKPPNPHGTSLVDIQPQVGPEVDH
jgi:hypothetical protein